MTESALSAARPATIPADVAIGIRGLVKIYDGVHVVDGLDLDVFTGECFALLGPNGAGKTTAIEILEGFRIRDGGDVHVLGTDSAHGSRAWRARIGVVAQSTGDSLDLSVREILDHFAVYHANPRSTGELIAAVGLESKARTRINGLSGGQRRRLDVALGVQGQPDLLFLDEPTTGLDPKARRQFWTLVEQLKAAGTTIVLTTHYLDEAAHLADRVGVINGGRIVEIAPPDELGGRLRGTATVSWLTGGRREEIVTTTPTATLRDVLARHPDGELDELSLYRPTLEDIYLSMIDNASSAVTTTSTEDPS